MYKWLTENFYSVAVVFLLAILLHSCLSIGDFDLVNGAYSPVLRSNKTPLAVGYSVFAHHFNDASDALSSPFRLDPFVNPRNESHILSSSISLVIIANDKGEPVEAQILGSAYYDGTSKEFADAIKAVLSAATGGVDPTVFGSVLERLFSGALQNYKKTALQDGVGYGSSKEQINWLDLEMKLSSRAGIMFTVKPATKQ